MRIQIFSLLCNKEWLPEMYIYQHHFRNVQQHIAKHRPLYIKVILLQSLVFFF